MIELNPTDNTYIPPEWADVAALPTPGQTAREVQDDLHRWWYFDSDSRLEDMPRGRTNCLGFTIVGSKELEARGVEHYIGVANGHATIVVPEVDESGRVTLLLRDMLSRRLNQNLNGAVERSSAPLSAFNEQIAAVGKAQMLVDGRMIAMNAEGYSRAEVGPEDVIYRHPWLSLSRSAYNPRTKLVINFFSPAEGRELLVPYGRFMEGLKSNDTQAASDALLEIPGRYPDTDVRSSLQKGSSLVKTPKIVVRLARDLAAGGDFEKAQAVTEAFFDSFSGEGDTRVAEYRADALRYIGRSIKHANDPRNWMTDQSRRMIEEARAVYTSLVDRPQAYKQSLLGKISVCETMLSEF